MMRCSQILKLASYKSSLTSSSAARLRTLVLRILSKMFKFTTTPTLVEPALPKTVISFWLTALGISAWNSWFIPQDKGRVINTKWSGIAIWKYGVETNKNMAINHSCNEMKSDDYNTLFFTFVIFYTPLHFEASQFYTRKCMNSRSMWKNYTKSA